MRKTYLYAIAAIASGLILFLVLSNLELIKQTAVSTLKEPETNTPEYLPVNKKIMSSPASLMAISLVGRLMLTTTPNLR